MNKIRSAHRGRRSSPAYTTPETLPSIVRLWCLRILVRLKVDKSFIKNQYFEDNHPAKKLGLDGMFEGIAETIDDHHPAFATIRAGLGKALRQSERANKRHTVPEPLAGNIARLASLVHLTDVESRLLEFAVLASTLDVMDGISELLGEFPTAQLPRILSNILEIPEPAIRQALNPRGILGRSGLIEVEPMPCPLSRKFDILTGSFAHKIQTSDADPVELLRGMVHPAAPAELDLDDFDHLAADLRILLPYLRKVMATKKRGVNVFLHGAPGTGKTQLARVLAHALGCDLLEVADEDEDGDPCEGSARLRALRAAQYFFAEGQAFLVFDEAEDVFAGDSLGFGQILLGSKGPAQKLKGWLNRMLEDNAKPILWLSNSIAGIDPAFLRRFDMIVEVPVPPRRQRLRILQEVGGEILDAAAITRLADSSVLSPAVVTRAASVVSTVRNELGDEGGILAMERLINNTLEAQGHAPIRRHDPARLPEVYDPCFINADADLAAVADGFVRAKAGRLCLYGPPGTGKTAYGRWLAQQLGVPLMMRRASDLLSKWVGGSEQNIAAAFREAESENAVLLLDEVDSFLQDRRGAQRSWEVTQVNELLTQMEAYSGVFIASTNLMQNLDQAALRRFDLKVRFEFLRADQTSELLKRHCSQLGLSAPGSDELARLRRLSKLTPGDFAAVIRQSRFRPLEDAGMFVTALEGECAVKEGGRGAMGFV